MGIIINGLTDTVTAADGSLNIGGDVTIPGELSYDDVTNIDSVGVITSRNIVFSGSTGTAGQFVLRRDSDGANIGQFRSDAGTNDISIGNGSSGSLLLKTGANTERVRISSNGAVGINTTADTRQLEIFNTSHATAALKSDTQSSLFFADSDTNIGQISYMHSDNYMYFRVNDAERLRITSDGNVGINTVNFPPNGKNLRIGSLGGAATDITRLELHTISSSGTKHFSIGNNGSSLNVYDETAGAERLRIDSGGRLLIGYTIDVMGNQVQSFTTGGNNYAAGRFADNTGGPDIVLRKSRNATVGSHTRVNNGDDLGNIFWGGSNGSAFKNGARITASVDGTPGSGDDMPGRLRFFTSGENSSSPTERMSITSGGDVLVGGQTAYTYDDTGASNTILDIWNSGNDKRGILSLSGQTNGGAAIGTIWFNNDNNAGTGPAANMKLSAAIQADAVTSDSNASSDAGGFLKFYTKPEAGALIESMRITSDGDIYQRSQRVYTVLNTEYRQLSGGVNTDSVGSWVDIKNFSYTPKRAGSLIVCHFQVQTWNGSSSNMNGDIYFRARFDQGTGSYTNVNYGGTNNRMTGNFDQDSNRQHLFYTHTFGFTAQNTNQHTINLQAQNSSSLATDFNWFHTSDNSNGCWIFEYDQ